MSSDIASEQRTVVRERGSIGCWMKFSEATASIAHVIHFGRVVEQWIVNVETWRRVEFAMFACGVTFVGAACARCIRL